MSILKSPSRSCKSSCDLTSEVHNILSIISWASKLLMPIQVQGGWGIDSTSQWENGRCIQGVEGIVGGHLRESYHIQGMGDLTPQTFCITCAQSRHLVMTYKAMLVSLVLSPDAWWCPTRPCLTWMFLYTLISFLSAHILATWPTGTHLPSQSPLLTMLALPGMLFLYRQDFCLSKAWVVVLLQLSGVLQGVIVLLCMFESSDCDLMIVLGLKLRFIISLKTMGITISTL